MNPTVRSSIMVIALALCVLVGGAAAFALNGSDDGPPARTVTAETSAPPPAEPATSAPPATSIPDAGRAAFDVLAQPQEPQDEPDAELAARLSAHAVNPAHARLVIPSAERAGRFYAAPQGQDAICLINGYGSGGCTKLADASIEGVTGVVECGPPVGGGRVLIYGLVPNGIAHVTISYADGNKTRIPVRSNAWSVAAPQSAEFRPTTVGWDAEDGRPVAIPIGYSPDANRRC